MVFDYFLLLMVTAIAVIILHIDLLIFPLKMILTLNFFIFLIMVVISIIPGTPFNFLFSIIHLLIFLFKAKHQVPFLLVIPFVTHHYYFL